MFKVFILEDCDTITNECFVRPLQLTREGLSDYVPSTSVYGGGPINRLTWTPVTRTHPFWVGKTVGDYRKHKLSGSEIFCKGKLPKFMITPLTESEFEATKYQVYLNNVIIPVGKYKGKTARYIQMRDPEYYDWLYAKTDHVKSLAVLHQRYIDDWYKDTIFHPGHN